MVRRGSRHEVVYDAARARAFSLAAEGRPEDALAQLNAAWTVDWPQPSVYAVDVARVRYLAGDYEDALGALQLAVHGADGLDPAVPNLVGDCVRRAPQLWTRALRVALAGGTTSQRATAAWGVLRARI